MSEPNKPPVLIVGTGAMATLFAARLAANGERIKMLGTWAAGLEALRQNGVRLKEPDGAEIRFQVDVTNDPSECRGTSFALVLVKSYQTARAANHLSMSLAEDGLALTLQNGLDNLKILSEALGPQRAALGVTTIGATLIEPGLVRNGGDGTINMGDHPRIGPLAQLLESAGFALQVVADTTALVWGKLVINAAINPLTALLRVPNGVLLLKPSTRALMGVVANETATVASSLGIQLPNEDPVGMVEEVARRTATNYSSMLKDVLRGSPTEIDSINGAIVRVGETLETPVQANLTLWHLVKALEPSQDRAQGIKLPEPAVREAPREPPVSTLARRMPVPTAPN
jgi:2-dehydropantoate 2-reductase